MEKKDGGDQGKPQAPVPGVDSVAGLSAGIVSTLIVHPLDLIKTRLQVSLQTTTGSTKSRPLSTMDVVRSFKKSKNPIAAAYRGLPINLVANSAGWACFFHFKAIFEDAIAAQNAYGLTSGDKLSGMGYFVASGLAGIATSCITNPLWLLRTRITSTDRSVAEAYPNMRVGAARVYQGEGWRGFYKGLGTSLIGTSHGAIQFAMYEPLRNAYFTWKGKQAREAGLGEKAAVDEKMSNEATLTIATASKVIASVATFPHQVVRNRLQNQYGANRYGAGISGVVRNMWHEGGFKVFYRGIVPGVLRTLPATCVTFIVVEHVRFHLPRWIKENDDDGHDGGVSGK
ncbi:mitochondrial folate carrier protein [Diaporthe amygdali]|uniref:mitochondrial folate carrier protein n=1 Tax=Phomopsis amygdali TaxID=1214568 RepID=UPI0022FE6DE3|nr:mitochondrial folate carrier protein [Diaporthe amygdali]KAJ0114928.1 mitochondrial folate carrier protein [Diaporthe amygdali]